MPAVLKGFGVRDGKSVYTHSCKDDLLIMILLVMRQCMKAS